MAFVWTRTASCTRSLVRRSICQLEAPGRTIFVFLMMVRNCWLQCPVPIRFLYFRSQTTELPALLHHKYLPAQIRSGSGLAAMELLLCPKRLGRHRHTALM